MVVVMTVQMDYIQIDDVRRTQIVPTHGMFMVYYMVNTWYVYDLLRG